MGIFKNNFIMLFPVLIGSVFFNYTYLFGLNLTREEVVKYALANSELIRIQEMAERKSALAIATARSPSLPQLNIMMDYDRNWTLQSLVFNGNSVKIGSEYDMRTAIGLRQSLFSGGRNRASKTVAEYSHVGNKLQGKTIRQNIIAQVEYTFYDVLVAVELASVSYIALKNARESLDLIQMRRLVGRGSKFEELRARGHVSSMVADSIAAENRIVLTRLKLKSLIGLDAETEMSLNGDLSRVSRWQVKGIDRDSLIFVAMNTRPDLKALKQQLRIEEQVISLEKSARWPKIDFVLSGQAQMQTDRFKYKNSKWTKNWATGLTLRVPVFDGFLTRSRINQAQTQLETVQYELLHLQRRVKLEVETSLRRVEEAVARVKAERQVVSEAEKAIQMAYSRYSTGAGTQLEILDAQLLLVTSQTNLALARRDRAIGLLELDRSLGLL